MNSLVYYRRSLRAWFRSKQDVIIAFACFFLLCAFAIVGIFAVGYLYVVIKNAEGV